MRLGQLSYSKVRALTRVACANTEEYFLEIALHGTASHVESLVREYRRAREAEELSREARQQATREVRYLYDEDGSLVVKVRLPAEAGALFIKALDAGMKDPNPNPDVSAETSEQRPSFAARRADALALIAESFLAHGARALSGGDRHQVVVHVDAEMLQERAAAGDRRMDGDCLIEEGPSIPIETARRLACDSSIVAIVEGARGEPLDVGRKTRSIPPALRRLLNARDRGCRFPGCPNRRYVDAHHIHHWADGGETKASNLITLCRFHHRQVHEGRVVIRSLDDGGLRFVGPDGHAFESPPPAASGHIADWQQLAVCHREQGLEIDRHTAATLWRGERMDHGLAIEVLLQRARRGQRHSSAEKQS